VLLLLHAAHRRRPGRPSREHGRRGRRRRGRALLLRGGLRLDRARHVVRRLEATVAAKVGLALVAGLADAEVESALLADGGRVLVRRARGKAKALFLWLFLLCFCCWWWW
jgi:hypothetical protein